MNEIDRKSLRISPLLLGLFHLLALTESVLVGVFPLYFGNAIQSSLVGADAGSMSLDAFRMVMVLFVGMLLFQLLKQLVGKLFSVKFAENWIMYALDKVSRIKTDHLSDMGSGGVNRRVVGEIDAMADYYTKGIGRVISSVLLIIASSVMLFSLIPGFTVVLLLCMGLGIPIGLKMVKHGRRLMKNAAEAFSRFNSRSTDYIASQIQLRSLGLEKPVMRSLRHSLAETLRVDLKAHWMAAAMIGGFFVYISASLGGLTTLTDHYGMLSSINAETVFAFLGYLVILVSRVSSFSSAIGSLQGQKAKQERLEELLRLPEDSPWAPIDFQEDIETLKLDNFSVKRGSLALIRPFDLELSTGDILLIRGPSGCGKTTLLRALYGMTEKGSKSELRVNNLRISGLRELGRKAAMLPQEIRFCPGSLKWNVELIAGREVDPCEIEELLDVMNLEERFRARDFDKSNIVESAANLSAGEKQRLALGAVLLRESDVLLLDESTSNIDPASEDVILRCIQDLSTEGCIVIMVAHRGKADTIATRKMLIVGSELMAASSVAEN
jgi:ABC-type multidrug transport system fused ATPase/permease subunit